MRVCVGRKRGVQMKISLKREKARTETNKIPHTLKAAWTVVWLISLTQQQQQRQQQQQQQEQEIWILLFAHISVSAIPIKAIFGTFVKIVTLNS